MAMVQPQISLPGLQSPAINGRVYAPIHLEGRGLHNAPLCFLKGLCVSGVALCTVRRVITITVNIPLWWMEQRWFKLKLNLDRRKGGSEPLQARHSHLEEHPTFCMSAFDTPWPSVLGLPVESMFPEALVGLVVSQVMWVGGLFC